MCQLNRRGRGAPSFLARALEYAVFISETKGANSADIIDSKEVIQSIQGLYIRLRTCAASLLATLGIVALDHAPAPAVRFGVRDGWMEDRAILRLAMKLRAHDQRQCRIDCEPIR